MRKTLSTSGLVLGIFLAAVIPVKSASAAKSHTIILKAAGSGAVLGFAAGLVSYPFAKSTNTIVAGVVVGALLGTVYGFYLVDRRDEAYQYTSGATTELDRIAGINEARDAILYRNRPTRAEFVFPVSVVQF